MRRPKDIRRSPRIGALWASMVVAAVPRVCESAEPEPAAAADSRASTKAEPLVEIVISEDVEDREYIRRGLRQETDRQLDIQRVDATVDPSEPRKIRVEITGVALQYQVTTDIERDGILLRDAKTVNCECSKSDLVELAVKEVVAALDELEEAPAPVEPFVAAPADPAEPTEDVPRLTWVGGVGIGLVVLGVGGLGAGGAMVAVGETSESSSEVTRERTDLRPPGYATLAVGAAALVGGVIAIVIDHKRLRARNRTTVRPHFDTTTTGLVITTRF